MKWRIFKRERKIPIQTSSQGDNKQTSSQDDSKEEQKAEDSPLELTEEVQEEKK